MIIRDKIDIGVSTYKVSLEHIVDKKDTDCFGEIDFFKGTIKIESDLMRSMQEGTLFHEILEGIDIQNDLKLNHKVLSVVAEQFYTVLKQNNMLK